MHQIAPLDPFIDRVRLILQVQKELPGGTEGKRWKPRLTERDWSKNQMGWYSGIMTGAAQPLTGFTGEDPNAATASNMLGLGATAVGALGESAV